MRRATLHDCTALAALAGQLGYPSTPGEISDRLSRIENNPDHFVFVAEQDGAVVGWLHVAKEVHLESGMFAEIVGVVVDESHRGTEWGRSLVEAAERWAQNNGCPEIRVRTNILRERAHKFYENNGYTLIKQQKVFGKIFER
jgi:N-acetylglutamate synthase-like GNAT family acetyltransferase